jgi:hypothetical protein
MDYCLDRVQSCISSQLHCLLEEPENFRKIVSNMLLAIEPFPSGTPGLSWPAHQTALRSETNIHHIPILTTKSGPPTATEFLTDTSPASPQARVYLIQVMFVSSNTRRIQEHSGCFMKRDWDNATECGSLWSWTEKISTCLECNQMFPQRLIEGSPEIHEDTLPRSPLDSLLTARLLP